MKERIFSAIQPTGELHFGNYFGAIKNWVALQDNYDCTYMVANSHAITMPYDPIALEKNTWNITYSLLALGVKAENLAIQSMIPEHTELCWLLSSFCSFGELSRMTQFKDKSAQLDEQDKNAFVSAGLFSYPILQAADILIHKAKYVPVGKDQEQHLELSRNIAERFNYRMSNGEIEHLIVPQALFTEIPKLMSLADPTKKMSKSLGDKHYISVFEDPKVLTKKVKSAVTDLGDDINAPMSAGVTNLFGLLKAAGAQTEYNQLMEAYTSGVRRYGDIKGAVAQVLGKMTEEFAAKKAEILANEAEWKEVIYQTAIDKRKIAQQTLNEVRELCGLPAPKY